MKYLKTIIQNIVNALKVAHDIGVPTFPEARISQGNRTSEGVYWIECRYAEGGMISFPIIEVSKEEYKTVRSGQHVHLMKKCRTLPDGKKELVLALSPHPITLEEFKVLEDDAHRVRLGMV